jgi:hypothetical protein
MGENEFSGVIEKEDEKEVEVERNRTPVVLFYKQRRIIYVDFSDFKNVDEISIFAEESSCLIRQNLPNGALVLTNVTGMIFNKDIYIKLMAYMKNNDPYIKSCAVVGMSRLMQILYVALIKFSRRDLKPFTTEKEAKDYLATK